MFTNLRSALQSKNISLVAYSRLLGITEKSIQNKMNGTTEFTLSEVQQTISLFPEYRLEYLFDEDIDKKKTATQTESGEGGGNAG